MLCKKSLTVTRLAPHTKKEQVSWPTPSWLRRLDLNQRPSGLSHKALPCLPLENIVALLAWSASQFSLFSHLSTTPVSATGGGVPLRPNERSSSRHNPERKKEQVSWPTPLWLRRLDLNQRPSGYEPDELPTAPLRDISLPLSQGA